MMQRRYDLDWLRVMAFGLLMLFHTGMLFSTWDWHVKNLETSDTFNYVMRFLHEWRMPLLFFISGSAVWFAMERYSTWRFFGERQRRLLVPLIFGMLVIIPPQVYFERLYHHQQYDSFWDFYRTVFTLGSYPEGNLSWHHLWYIPYIWAYSMIMLPVFVWLRSRFGRPVLERVLSWLQKPGCLWLIFVPAALSDILLRPWWPYDVNGLFDDWANFTHKLSFFVTGFVLASGAGVYDTIAAHRRKFLLGGVVTLAMLHPVWVGAWHLPGGAAGYRFLDNFHIWMWLLTLLGYGRRYLNFNHPFLKSANEAVYPFYILHQTVIVILGYYLVYRDWSIGAKFLAVVTGTFLITWTIYLAVRPWNLLRVPMGMKWRQQREDLPRNTRNPRKDSLIEACAAAQGSCATVIDCRASQCKEVQLGNVRQGWGRLVPTLGFVHLLGAGTGRPRPWRKPVFAQFVLILVIAAVLAACSRRQGEMVCRTIEAPSLSRNVLGISDLQPVAIYLPPSYRDQSKRFPVLYLLSNFKTDVWRYTGGSFQGFHLNEALDRLAPREAGREMIVVVPNTVHFLGGSCYLNSPLSGNWSDFIVQDLVQYIDSHFRTIPSAGARGLAGHGIGGTGALNLALEHPEVFGSVYALSPAVFDPNGLRDFGAVSDRQLAKWQANVRKWNTLGEPARRKAFRDYIQTHLNSPAHDRMFEGLYVSYAAAVAPDLSLPYPHIAFPDTAARVDGNTNLLAKFEDGMGGWEEKLSRYLAKGRALRSITVEYGKDDEYQWIRRGADYVSGLMRSRGITNTLAIHEGGHESRLGRRLETAMLPTMARALSEAR